MAAGSTVLGRLSHLRPSPAAVIRRSDPSMNLARLPSAISATRVLPRHSAHLHHSPVPRNSHLPKSPIRSSRKAMAEQRWSTRMVFLTSTMLGSIMYVVGVNAQLKRTKDLDSVDAQLSLPPEPSPEEFNAALALIRSILPAECISSSLEDLKYHGLSPWTYHHPDCLPGVVLYPRSTEDVSKIAQVAHKYSIPIVPFSGGTSLEGHFHAPSLTGRKANDAPQNENQLKPGHSFTVDFSRNMNKIISIHESDLDVVVQPGVSYEDLNRELQRSSSHHKLFFPLSNVLL